MTASKTTRSARAKARPRPAPSSVQSVQEPVDVPPRLPMAPSAATSDEVEVPSGAEKEEPSRSDPPDPGNEPLPKEYVIVNGPASYGPVKIDGKLVTACRNRLYLVSGALERADILGTGFFRAATRNDLARSEAPSAGPGVALTRELLPPGALKKE